MRAGAGAMNVLGIAIGDKIALRAAAGHELFALQRFGRGVGAHSCHHRLPGAVHHLAVDRHVHSRCHGGLPKTSAAVPMISNIITLHHRMPWCLFMHQGYLKNTVYAMDL